MKTFETPAIELIEFEMEDVITTSVDPGLGDNQTPPAVRQ